MRIFGTTARNLIRCFQAAVEGQGLGTFFTERYVGAMLHLSEDIT